MGVFDSKVEAAAAYDAAMLQEAVKKGTTASRMPEKRFVLRSCQKHYAVESVNSPKFRPCEQCLAHTYSGAAQYTAAYIWNGENYMLKISDDTEFLHTHEGLKQWLGESFEFEGNPFHLNEGVENYVSLVDEEEAFIGDLAVPATPMGSSMQMAMAGTVFGAGTETVGYAPETDHLNQTAFEPQNVAAEVDKLRGSSAPHSFSMLKQNEKRPATGVPGGNLPAEPNPDARPTTTFVKQNQEGFGTPSKRFTDHGGGISEWGGRATLGSRFVMDMPFSPGQGQNFDDSTSHEEKKADPPSPNPEDSPPSPPTTSTSTSTAKSKTKKAKSAKRVFEVLDISRVVAAWKQVQHEQTLNEMMHHGSANKPPNENKHPLAHLMKSGSNNKKLSKLKAKKEKDHVNTYAVYRDHGAILSMEQQRKPLAHRNDQIWCRTDVGEWNSLYTQGANMRTFEFGVKMKKEGQKKQQDRKRVGVFLRREYEKDISEVDIPKIHQLIAEALELKGSRLKLDVETANIFLRKYAQWAKSALECERVIRGFLGRCKFSKRHKLTIAKFKERGQYMRSISAVARSNVEEFLKKGTHKAARRITRPAHSTVQIMDNDYWLVAIYSLEHYDYVNLSKTVDEFSEMEGEGDDDGEGSGMKRRRRRGGGERAKRLQT